MELYYNKNITNLIITVILTMSVITNINGRQNSYNRYYNSNYFTSSLYEDSILKTPALIQKYGYPAEIHNVITHDGYILQMHRIPNPGKTPVYLQHGLASSSAEFVFYGPNVGLGFILHDAGYDVWLGNHRGNRYNKRHLNIKKNDITFWNFTLTELGKYDIKAFIDRIIKVTKFEKIHYIGNSQGCAVIFILCDVWPEYSDKLIGVQAMAPAIFVKNLRSPLAKLGIYLMNRFKYILPMFEGKILQNMADMGFASILGLLCHDGAPTQPLCGYILSLTVGFNMKETNKTMLPVLLNHYPSGASVLQVAHYKQFVETGEFKKFDYGRRKNLNVYGQAEPPFYDLKKMKANITLYYSSNDLLVVNEDVEYLYNQLTAPVNKLLYDEYGFTHMNFIAGTHCNNFYYNFLIKTMKSLDNEL